ncbi:MAG: phenylalanine 4-monooxygenase [Rhodospirillales bacterium]|nr:phenylalanine 4-monooxygenase [Rhodospirillales bacterium]
MKPAATAENLRPDYTVDQPWDRYTASDHQTWRTLFERQAKLLPGRACGEFIAGLDGLGVAADGIPHFDRLSDVLEKATGWRIVAVPGLVPDDVFFGHLAARRFPVTWWIRKPAQMDYLQEPDVFHDIYGHVPLLMNPIFGDYMQAYGAGGLKALGLDALVGFDLMRIMRTKYRIDTFQKTYFAIDNFDQLFAATRPDFAPYYRTLRTLSDIGAGEVVDSDTVLNRGTGEGWADTPDT